MATITAHRKEYIVVRRNCLWQLGILLLSFNVTWAATGLETRHGTLVSRTPDGTLHLQPGAVATISITFQNTGMISWSADQASPNYVELRSVNSAATASQSSPLAWQWIDGSNDRIGTSSGPVYCASYESNPANTVTLLWTAPGDDADSGTATTYDLRYSTSDITSGNFSLASVFSSTPSPSPAGSTDSCAVVGLNPATTYYFAIKAADEVPNWSDVSNTAWKTTAGVTGTYTFTIKAPTQTGLYTLYLALYHPGSSRIITAGAAVEANVWDSSTRAVLTDYNGDRRSDVGLYEPANGGWYVATSSGTSFVPAPGGWLGSWGANASAYKELSADFNGDRRVDVGLYEPAYGQWFVATSTGTAFTPSPAGWLSGWGASATNFRAITGDFNGDGKDDVGLYEPAYGQWFVATSTGTSFTPSPTAWLGSWGANASAFREIVGDFNGDGKDDVGLYEPAYGQWFVATSTGTSFTPSPTAWLGSWGANATAYRQIVGDYNGDAKTDVGLYEPANGGWYVATSSGTSFVPAPGGWLGSWGANATAYRVLRSSGLPSTVDSVSTAPAISSTPSLTSYPNPFNPTTAIRYSLPRAGRVELAIFDLQGRKQATLVDGDQDRGVYTVTWNAARQASGVYFLQLRAGGSTLTKKILLLQ